MLSQALGALESSEAMKQEGLRILAIDMLCLGALRYGRLDFVPSALLQRVRKEDHLPLVVAGVAAHAEQHYNSTQLVSVGGLCAGCSIWSLTMRWDVHVAVLEKLV